MFWKEMFLVWFVGKNSADRCENTMGGPSCYKLYTWAVKTFQENIYNFNISAIYRVVRYIPLESKYVIS